jgi:hypothetical protein
MKEIAPGILHWTARHPKINSEVSSYWLPGQRVLLDPITVPDEVEDIDEILLTNRHHLRASLEARERLGAAIRAPAAGMHEYSEGEPVEPYEFGDKLAEGEVTAYEVASISPDEAALHIPAVSALAVADGVIHYDAELAFVPDALMDDPDETKRGLAAAYARLSEKLDFENLLTAHGTPIAGGASGQLREFAENAA